jgi:hypothetical protein
MKHLKVFESFDKQEDQFDIENVMLYMVNVLDNYKVNFFDVDNNMINSNDKDINDFQLTKDFHSIRRSRFMIEIMQENRQIGANQLSIHDIAEIGIEMSTTIKHLEREGWILSDYHLNQSKLSSDLNGKVVFYYIHYTFSKEDQEIEPTKSLQDSVPFNKLQRAFEKEGIDIKQNYTRYLDDSIEIDDWYSEFLDYRGVEDVLDKVTEILGATEWEWKQAKNVIVFNF